MQKHIYSICINKTFSRSSQRGCSIKKLFLTIPQKTHLCQSLRPVSLLKKWLRCKCFPVNFTKFSRTHFLHNTCGRPQIKGLGCRLWSTKGIRSSIYNVQKWSDTLLQKMLQNFQSVCGHFCNIMHKVLKKANKKTKSFIKPYHNQEPGIRRYSTK